MAQTLLSSVRWYCLNGRMLGGEMRDGGMRDGKVQDGVKGCWVEGWAGGNLLEKKVTAIS